MKSAAFVLLAGLGLATAPLCAEGQGRVETVPFKSTLLGQALPYNVILPLDYAQSPGTRYPVLYLLHGLSDHYSTWVLHTNLVDHLGSLRLIVVTPEGNNGWYTDSATVARDKYESYLFEELIPHVQSRYRTLEDGYARGVAGLSMGGYGALKLALKHPDEFAFAASMSGALGAAQFTEQDGGGWPLVWESIRQAFGPLGSPTREANDLFALVRGLSAERVRDLPYLYLDCGNDDGLVRSNLALAALLVEKKIPHEYRQQPGVHNWELWDQQIREVLALAAHKLPRR